MSKKRPHPYAHEPLWKRYLPHTLFGRAFLILALPILLIQIIAFVFFYERHWDSVTRNMARAFSGEVLLLKDLYEQGTPVRHLKRNAGRLGILLEVDESKEAIVETGKGKHAFPDFYDHIAESTDLPFMIRTKPPEDDLYITLLLRDGKVMELVSSKKRLVSSTTYIFLLWLAGSSVLLVLVATLFLRNQIRPIKQLAIAAKRFGLGHDTPNFSPRGAEEVRMAGKAFVEMRARIERYVNSRTEMLAGISHDLRTPLTRMKLQIAMTKLDAKTKAELEGDILDMEHMVAEYLDFAKGEGGETALRVNAAQILVELVEDYERQKAPVQWHKDTPKEQALLELRPRAFRRAMQNLIDNGIRYGEKVELSVSQDAKKLVVEVHDHGPGIPEDKIELVFQPFTRLDAARTPAKGAAGLGLSIARDLIQAQGGKIQMENSRNEAGDITGLCVRVTLPKT